MCGLVGVIQYRSLIPRETRARALRILFSELMLRTEIRGDDATGVYQIQSDGDWMLTKKGVKSSEWLRLKRGASGDPAIYRDFMETWTEHPRELSAIVGHCRKATTGSRGEDNRDNHPFEVQLDARHAILGVHNGTLLNHEVVFEKLKLIGSQLRRQGSVDSESIFHLLYHATEQGNAPITKEALSYLGERLDGAYAVITANTRFPNQIAVFRNERPMDMMMIRPLNVVLLASERKFFESALDRYTFHREFVEHDLPELDFTDRILAERDFRIFDNSRPFPEDAKLNYADFDKISTTGEMRKSSFSVLEEWKVPVAKPASAAPSTSSTPASGAAGTVYSGTKSGASSIPASHQLTPTVPAAIKPPLVVEAEVEEEDDTPEFIRAKSLGLCSNYDTLKEVAAAIGTTEELLTKMTIHTLANKLGQLHFSMGYALAQHDRKSEVEDVCRKGREQLAKLEAVSEKKKRGEKRIWELKQIIGLILGITESGYSPSVKTISVVLESFPKLKAERRAEILATARAVLEDQGTMTLVSQLQKKFEEAERVKKGRRTAAAE